MAKEIVHAEKASVLQYYTDSSFILKKVIHSTELLCRNIVNILLEDQNKDSKLMQRIKKERNLDGEYTILINTDCYAANWKEEDFTTMINKEVHVDVCSILQKNRRGQSMVI